MLPIKNEITLIKYANELIALLGDDKAHTPADAYKIINAITKILGPDYDEIPTDLKKGLGVAYGSALAETELLSKSAYTRSALSLLRAAVKLGRGPKIQLDKIDEYIVDLEKEIASCEKGGEEAMLDKLWKQTNRALDYITLLIFNGYGEIQGKGFQFTKKTTEQSTDGKKEK